MPWSTLHTEGFPAVTDASEYIGQPVPRIHTMSDATLLLRARQLDKLPVQTERQQQFLVGYSDEWSAAIRSWSTIMDAWADAPAQSAQVPVREGPAEAP